MSQNSRNRGFFLLFLLDDRGIRIREAQKHVDPDPEHCLTQTSVDFYTLCCSMATGMHFRLEQLTVFLPD
jgi:hypothetical protein